MKLESWALVLGALLAGGSAWAAKPLPTPSLYISIDKGLSFRTPTTSTYCPLPKDWIGSDHGTTVFLTPPKICGGVGYPSSGRGFSPDTTPRINVYYGWWLDDFPPEPPCKAQAKAQLFGRQQSVCRVDGGNMKAVQVYSRYQAEGSEPAEVYFTLVTTPKRYAADMKVFRAMLLSVKRCKASGCPATGEFF